MNAEITNDDFEEIKTELLLTVYDGSKYPCEPLINKYGSKNLEAVFNTLKTQGYLASNIKGQATLSGDFYITRMGDTDPLTPAAKTIINDYLSKEH